MTRNQPLHEVATELPLQALVDERLVQVGSAPVQPPGTGMWTGPFQGRRHGHGVDFDDLRPYAEGDDPRHIDWKVSARRNVTHTRLYREEKDHVLSVALDLRKVMFNGSSALRAVTAGRLAARLLWHASARGSRVRLLVLGNAGIRSTRARPGESGALDACGLISDMFEEARGRAMPSSNPASTAPTDTDGQLRQVEKSRICAEAPELNLLLRYLLRQGRQLGSVVLLSGMDQAGDGFDEQLASMACSRPLAAVLLDDAMLLQGLPPGHYAWQNENGVRQITLDSRRCRQLQEQLALQRHLIIDRFRAGHVPLCATKDGIDNVVPSLQQAGFLP